MTPTQELAVKALQGAEMAQDDVLELYKLLCRENPLGAATVMRALEMLRQANVELRQIVALLESEPS
jgi:hypothetical protein